MAVQTSRERLSSPLKIVVITQETLFFVPENIDLIAKDPALDVQELLIIDCAGSLKNRRVQFMRWFGLFATVKMALRMLLTRGVDVLNAITGERFTENPSSLRSVGRRHGIPVRIEPDVNAAQVLDRLAAHAVDVIVSFSAPQIFKRELLEVPRWGCLNLHCSLLPHYRGLLPSFWVLLREEFETGATVHLMDTEIDEGSILSQVKVDIRDARSMWEVLARTKAAGGKAMLKVLQDVARGEPPVALVREEEGSYYSWPSHREAQRFRQKGYRLV